MVRPSEQTPEQIVQTLQDLVSVNRDSERGFRTASEGVKDTELKRVFLTYSQERAEFASELERLVAGYSGKEPHVGSSATGALHRGWINIRSAVTGGSSVAILSECERGEDSAVESYRDAMQQPLPTEVARVIQNQYTRVQEAHDRIRNLRDAARAAS